MGSDSTNKRLCQFCKKNYQEDNIASVYVALIYYKYGGLGRFVHNASKLIEGLDDITLGSNQLDIFIPRCEKCYEKHSNISFFDFSTKQEVLRIVDNEIALYIKNEYRVELVLYDNRKIVSIFLSGNNKKEYLTPVISYEKSIVIENTIKFILIALSSFQIIRKIEINSLLGLIQEKYFIPKHEIQIFINFITRLLKTSKNVDTYLIEFLNTADSLDCTYAIEILFYTFKSSGTLNEQAIAFLLKLEILFDIKSDLLNTYKEKKFVHIDVDLNVLKVIYRKACKLCHPDLVKEEYILEANKLMQELNEAYTNKNIQKIQSIYEVLLKNNPYI